MKIGTKLIHCQEKNRDVYNAVISPIYTTTTYTQSEPGVYQGFDYSRAGHPTRSELERTLAEIEGGVGALTFSSGLAAEQAIIQILKPGARVAVCDDVYGGTGRLFRMLWAKWGIEFHFHDLSDAEEVDKVLNESFDLIWVETPTNPTLKLIDIAKIAQNKKEAILVVDNTFATPVFQRPLTLGADIVLHSATKYLGGHSDLVAGCLMTRHQGLYEQLKFVQFAAGAIQSPQDAALLHRSLKTLHVRMAAHAANAQKIAEFLEDHPKVSQTFYPGLKSHRQYELAKKQMSGYSGMISIELNSDYAGVKRFLAGLNLFTLAESLGGIESLINHPEKMTHASVPVELRKKLGIHERLIRLSVGIEDLGDLIEDLKAALSAV